MYINRRVNIPLIWKFARKPFIFFLIYSTGITAAYFFLNLKFLAAPFTPVAIVGTAVALYVGFKNNSAYDRLWEGRRIWGSIVNFSRSWGMMVLDYIDGNPEVKRQLIYRHLAFIHALKNQLRKDTVWHYHGTDRRIVESHTEFRQHHLDTELKVFLPEDEVTEAVKYKNAATHLLKKQSAILRQLYNEGALNDFRFIEMEKLVVEFYNQQGACERIKGFPLPRQYAFFSYAFTWVLILVLPFGLLGEFQKIGEWSVWFTVPTHIIVSWIFNTMEKVGDTSENPFENGINDVPMTAICRTIEIDLKEMLGETDIPEKIKPVDGILM
ncbi:bestrophin family ion channel [Lacibacter sp. MH-610]|uniref:bestrophin family protein n=1 Tax=Lacibacter sp. MH-610 TaxID=3020883 RepID=UPI0038914A2D